MPARVRTAINKLWFCYTAAADTSTFFRLLRNTKKFRWFKEHPSPVHSDAAESYRLHLLQQNMEVRLRTFQGDIDIFYEVFWKKTYDTGTPVPSCTSIVDIGSNVGMSALWFLAVFPKAQLLCLEPEDSNFRLLKQNIRQNYPHRNVKLIQAAVLQDEGTVSLHASHLKYNTKVAQELGNTQAVSMQSILEKEKLSFIDLLKIDAEGSEKDIFSGNTDWLRQVGALIIETHGAEAERVCLETLQAAGFHTRLLHPEQTNCLYFAVRDGSAFE